MSITHGIGIHGVDLYSTCLDDDAALPIGSLSREERKRAKRFRDPRHASRFRAGRAWLRLVLGEHLGRAPRDIVFVYGPYGKPSLEGAEIEFNLAHADAEAILAVGTVEPVGVDIERATVGVYDPGAARLVLSEDELGFIESDDRPNEAFAECWVRKEAYAKMTGFGLVRRLAALTLTGPHRSEPDDLAIVEGVPTKPGFRAALAVGASRSGRQPESGPV